MNDLISHFNVSYKLFESDGNGGKKPFDSTKGLYTADVIADTAEEARESEDPGADYLHKSCLKRKQQQMQSQVSTAVKT